MSRTRTHRPASAPSAAGAPPHVPAIDRRAVERIDRLSYLLDNSIRIPGLGYRIGWDAVVGLIPGIGDGVGLVLSAYVVLEAARLGVSRGTLVRMAGNVAVEAIVGAVPLLGDVFDATWKANARNMHLVRQHLGVDDRARRPKRWLGWLLVGGLVLLTGALLYGVGLLVGMLF